VSWKKDNCPFVEVMGYCPLINRILAIFTGEKVVADKPDCMAQHK